MKTRADIPRVARTYRDAIAAEVRAELARRKISYRIAAKSAGLSSAGFSERINGHRAFTTDHLFALATAHDLDLDKMLTPPTPPIAAERSAS